MSVFVKAAYTSGCSVKDITAITGTETEDEVLAQTLAKMNEIESMKNELQAATDTLTEKKKSYNEIKKDFDKHSIEVKGGASVLGAVTGVISTIGLVDAFARSKSFNLRRFANSIGRSRAKSAGAVITMLVLCAVAGNFIGKAIANKTNLFKSHNEQVSQRQAEEYKQNEIEPLKAKVETLEQEIYEMENAFKGI